jgi:Ca2+-binding RTX toxin-like protein
MVIFDGTDYDDDIDGSIYADDIEGYDGDDLINGFEGNDILSGSFGDDTLFGGYGHDDLYGGSGWDDLYGGSGLDYLSGGSGDDLLSGGLGRDTLVGGSGEDLFVFTKGTSGLSTSTVDTITDWNRSDDWIDMTVRGTAGNYREAKTSATSIGSALIRAEDLFPSASIKHVFLYNSKTDTGYLVSDLNSDGQFDTGVVLKNAGLASDMSYTYII